MSQSQEMKRNQSYGCQLYFYQLYFYIYLSIRYLQQLSFFFSDLDELPINSERNTSGIEVEEKQPEKQIVEEQPSEFLSNHAEVMSIDGNIELVSTTPSSVPASGISGNKIKINISKPLPVIPTKEKDNKSENEFPAATYIDPFEPFPPGEEPEPVYIKPALQGVKLKKLPPVKRGTELSGLCSIM